MVTSRHKWVKLIQYDPNEELDKLFIEKLKDADTYKVGIRSYSVKRQNRTQKMKNKTKKLLDELNTLPPGVCQGDVVKHRTYHRYVKLIIVREEFLIEEKKFIDVALAAKEKDNWFAEKNSDGSINIWFEKTNFTSKEIAVIRMYFNTPIDGMVRVSDNGMLQVFHETVSFKMARRNEDSLSCATQTVS